MKPTLKASIGGYAFTLEEDAYQQLDSYLDLLKKHFATNPECNEIIADIEARMSELLQIHLNKEQTVVTISEAQQIIKIMGHPRDFGDNEENSWGEQDTMNTTFHDNKDNTTADIKKGLYRDPGHSVLGGVFGGLSHYFRIDPVVLRVIYIALFIITISIEPRFGFFPVILYVIMWIIMPKASTFYQRLSMTGTNPSIEDIENRDINNASRYKGSGFRTFLRIVGGIICGIIAFVTLIFILAIVGGAIWIHLNSDMLSPSDYLAIFGLDDLNLKISFIMILLLPLLGIFYFSMKGLLCSRLTMRDLIISIVCIFILLGSGLYFGNSVYNYARMIQHSGWVTDAVPLQTSSDTIYIRLDKRYLGARPPKYFPDNRIQTIIENNKQSLFFIPSVILTQDSTINSLNIEIRKRAEEETFHLAKQKAEDARLDYILNDSCIIFSPKLYNKENPWDAEQFDIIINSPVNKTVIIESPL